MPALRQSVARARLLRDGVDGVANHGTDLPDRPGDRGAGVKHKVTDARVCRLVLTPACPYSESKDDCPASNFIKAQSTTS